MDTDTSNYAWRKGSHYGIRECRAIERAIERGIIKPHRYMPTPGLLEMAEYFGPSIYSPTAPGCRIRIPGLGEFPTDLGDDDV